MRLLLLYFAKKIAISIIFREKFPQLNIIEYFCP